MPSASWITVTAEANAQTELNWQGLDPKLGPFVDPRFIQGLINCGCVGGDSGWHFDPVILGDDSAPQAIALAWIKHHSHGEFVFDWHWARAAHGAGLNWYPKLLVAAPFSPITGPRLIGADGCPDTAQRLIQALTEQGRTRQVSSIGINFCRPDEAAALSRAGWLMRHDYQFHWPNRGYRTFDDFLSQLQRKPRKNIRAERRRVEQEGWQISWKNGAQMTESDLALITHCYLMTFARYGNMPMLNQAFFTHCAEQFGEQFLVCLASPGDDQPAQAAAIFWRDQHRLYGRYWGSLVETRDLHFELCYYQGIEYCIRHGLSAFEPGAQGEHKIRRGFLPQKTHSAHYIRHPGMRQAITHALQHEAQALAQYREQLRSLEPYQ